MTDNVDFHCDIVAKVPCEISEMILQYLPLRQVFQAQRVSHRWRDILASPGVVTAVLWSWYPASDPILGVRDGLSAKTVALLNAEHVDAYRSGNAFSMSTLDFEVFPDDLNSDLVAYADGVVAWTDARDCYICRSLDVKTGTRLSFVTGDRSPIRHLAISSSMIAAISTSGKCFLWTFREQMSVSLRMPSARVTKIMLSSNSLVVAFHPRFMGDGLQIEMITWTLNSQCTHSFWLSLHGFDLKFLETKLLLDKQGASVVLLERDLDGGIGEIESVHFTRAGLTGVIHARGTAQGPRRESLEDYAKHTILAQTNQYATAWAFVGNASGNDSSAKFVRVRYDFDRDRVEFDTRLIKGFDRSHAMSDMFFYKDAAYYRHYLIAHPLLRVIDFDQSVCSRAPMSTLISWYDSWPQKGLNKEYRISNHYRSLLFGDENFLVNIFNGGMVVWSFDKDTTMVDENTAYREARRERFHSSGEGTTPASTISHDR